MRHLQTAFITALVAVTGTLAQFTVDNATVALWRFDEGSGTTTADAANNGCDGTLKGNIEWVDGAFGTALKFDGLTTCVLVPDNDKLEMSGDFTVELWIKPLPTGLTSTVPIVGTLVSKHQNRNKGDHGWWLRMCYFKVNGFVFSGHSFYNYAGSSDIEAGNWLYGAFTYTASSGECAFYVNGEKVETRVYTGLGNLNEGETALKKDIRDNNLPFMIGAQGDPDDPTVPDGNYEGTLDEIRMSDKVRSAAEIKAHWDANKDKLPPRIDYSNYVDRDVYYLAPDGVDAPDRGSIDKPFGSFRYAVQIPPGDTLLVRGGTYDNTKPGVYAMQVATEDDWTVIKNYPGEFPILDGDDIQPEGIKVKEAKYLLIEGLAFTNTTYSGIFIGGNSRNITVRYCIADNAYKAAMGAWHVDKIRYEYCIAAHSGWHVTSGSSGMNLWEMQGFDHVILGCVSFNHIDICGKHCFTKPKSTDGNGYIADLGYDIGSAKFINCIAFDNGGAGFSSVRTGVKDGKGKKVEFINCTGVNNACKPPDFFYQNEGQFHVYGAGAIMRNCVATGKHESDGSLAKSHNVGSSNNSAMKFKDLQGADFDLQEGSPAIGAADPNTAPPKDIGFDAKAIKYLPNGYVFRDGTKWDWMKHAIDYEYIKNNGGIPAMFAPAERDNQPDAGAYEYGVERIVKALYPDQRPARTKVDLSEADVRTYDIMGRTVDNALRRGQAPRVTIVETPQGMRLRTIRSTLK